MKKLVSSSSAGKVRTSNEFYTIQLDNSECILTNEILLENVSEEILKARNWYSPELYFLNFKGKRLLLRCCSVDSCYKLSFIIEKDRLAIACSCGMAVEKLCLHGYRMLSRIMHYSSKTYFFQKYAHKGLAKTAFANKKYFDFNSTREGLEIRAKPQIGFVHLLTNSKVKIGFQDVLKFPDNEPSDRNAAHDISPCYMILIPRKPYIFPFVLPVLGKCNKLRTGIKGFGKFLSSLEKQYEHLHTEEQKLLNQLCLELYKKVEDVPGLFREHEETWEQIPQGSPEILSYWCRIFHLLRGQYAYTHTFWQQKYLKRGPQRNDTEKVTIGLDVPKLQFRLTEYTSFYQMKLEILIKGEPVNDIESVCSFLLEHEDTIYLLRSFKDAGIVDWFFSIDNKLTIFKEQFKDFENSYLKRLKKDYIVHIKRLSRKNKSM